jgi:hypothetical protein
VGGGLCGFALAGIEALDSLGELRVYVGDTTGPRDENWAWAAENVA